MKIRDKYQLKEHNTFGIEATAGTFVEYETEEELQEIVTMVREKKLTPPFLHIGAGSNILFTKDFPGTVFHSCIKSMEVLSDTSESVLIKVGSGYVWDDFVEYCVEHGWYGAENLSNIPGEVGAASVQNIGAYGVEVKDIIQKVEAIDITTGEHHIFSQGECHYSYRDSIFKRPDYKRYIITFVTFELRRDGTLHLDYGNLSEAVNKITSTPTLSAVRQAVISVRDSKLPDPKVIGSAGSFFMNPIVPLSKLEELRTLYPDIPSYPVPDSDDHSHVKLAAGWLIQQAGWKGRKIGHAGVYDRQALVIVNHGGATGAEVLAVAQAVISAVSAKFGIELHPEANIF